MLAKNKLFTTLVGLICIPCTYHFFFHLCVSVVKTRIYAQVKDFIALYLYRKTVHMSEERIEIVKALSKKPDIYERLARAIGKIFLFCHDCVFIFHDTITLHFYV